LCRWLDGATVSAMTAGGESRRLGLEVRFDAERIEGRLYDRDDGGRLDRSFYGWLGLLSALEAARDRHPLTPDHRQGER
jgi:hypothetical protein